jgi:hypothetical protein
MATPIRIKRSAVAGKRPTTEQLQLGELAVNFYDGKVFFKQDTNGVGIGTRIVEIGAGSTSFVGKTLYVTTNGNDDNTGLDDKNAKATIKAAVALALPGDTVKVLPGTYVENNPINLPDNVSVEGSELRRCLVQPQNTGEDLFYVGQGNHITDLSFVGSAATNNSAVISFRPLVGVASDRFFDAARMIRTNLDFIAYEAVGYLTSTDYKNPAFTVTPGSPSDCADDIKDIYRAICHDITRGGNSKCVGAGKSYYTDAGALQHITGTDSNGYSVKQATIDAIRYSVGIAQSCINNVSWTGGYQSQYYQVKDLSMQADSATGSNTDIGSCANVISAVNTCAGIVTTIIDNGLSALGGAGINTNFPGNSGAIASGILTASSSPLQGTGIITKGPYIRNCTNFIPNSIGARIDGFNADEGDKVNNIGVQGSFNVDSYTQYNQGGIGVSVTNGAYAQLVSLFTICDDIAVYTGGGGQCDLTNSNSSFGTKGLVSQGVGDYTSKCNDRYTGEVTVSAGQAQAIVVVSGLGNNRPYQGQALYFDRIYYEVDSVVVSSGGTGYTSTPVITIDSPTGPGIAIDATAIPTIANGSVTTIDMISNGTQYTSVPNVTVSAPNVGINTATATAVLRPIYYGVDSATQPVAGVSTITLKTNLNNTVGVGTTVFLARQSFQIVSSHSFQYIGAGNTIETAYPSKGGVTIQENEVVKLDGGDIVYTSTDQDGNFRIGDGVVIDQAAGAITGDVYVKSLFSQVTPFILALGGD